MTEMDLKLTKKKAGYAKEPRVCINIRRTAQKKASLYRIKLI